MPGHVVYVASGVARGHLMSAAVVRQLLSAHGHTVSVLTSSRDGLAFIEALTGHGGELLGGGYGMAFGSDYDLELGKTVLGLGRYFLSGRGLGDARQIGRATANAAVLVNDGHPAALVANPRLPRRRRVPLVNVLPENALAPIEQITAGWLPGPMGRSGRGLVRRALMHGDRVIVNTLDGRKFFQTAGKVTFLPPIFEAADASPAAVRDQLGVAPGRPLFAAYLNPLFRRAALLEHLIRSARRHRAFLYLVSESLQPLEAEAGYEHLRIVPWDWAFGEKIRAADLLITGAGIAGPIQAYAYGVPLVVLATRQPEQLGNAAIIAGSGMGLVVHDPGELPDAVVAALSHRPQPHRDLAARTADGWLEVIRAAENGAGAQK